MAEEQARDRGVSMATIVYGVKDLERDLGSVKEIEEHVQDLGMEIEVPGNDEITFDISPNRPDLLDYTGFVRAYRYLLGKSTPDLGKYITHSGAAPSVTVTRSVKGVRPFIAAMVVKNVNLGGGRLKYLINFTEKFSTTYGRKRRKIAMGLHDLEAVRGDLVYDASADGRFMPLGSNDEMTFDEIVERHSKGLEYGYTVVKKGGKALYPYLKDSEKILSMIPIINSKATAVRESTTSLFVDITGIDKKAVERALDILACSFIDSGCEIYKCRISYGNGTEHTPHLGSRRIAVSPAKASSRIGVAMKVKDMPAYAAKAGYEASIEGNKLVVRVPPYRLDVINDQDVIEDIAIGYGYSNIAPSQIFGMDSVGVPHKNSETRIALEELMIGLGYNEALNMHLTNEDINFSKMEIEHHSGTAVEVLESKTEAITMLRTSLLPQLLQNLSESTSERMPQKLFEVGSSFMVEGGKVIEDITIAFLSEHSKANLAEARTVVNYILGKLGMKADLGEGADSSMIGGRTGIVTVNGIRRGAFGELHPKVLSNFGIEEPVVGGEIVISHDVRR